MTGEKSLSKLLRKHVVIVAKEAEECAFCHNLTELRPYGPKGEKICFPCAMNDEDSAKAQFQKVLDAGPTQGGVQ